MGAKKARLLHDGYFHIDMGLMVYGKMPYYGRTYRAALKPMLVEGDGYLLLVDSGAGNPPEKYNEYYRLERPVTLETSLADAGYAPRDVTHVVYTHLHFDHMGNLELFAPTAELSVQRTEYEYGLNPHRFQKGGYLRELIGSTRFRLLEGEGEIVPGVRVVPNPGHTPGHQAVVVEPDNGGRIVYCGDTCPVRENYEDRNITGILHNPVDALESIDALRALGGTPVFCHDSDQMEL